MNKLFAILGLALMAGQSYGQGTDNILKASQQNFSLGTARSAAMSGAFTSLGADASSMNINPAGLAMYNRGEVSVTPGFRINNISSSYNSTGYQNTTQRNESKFNIGNFGAVYANGTFAVGVGYSRLADFNGQQHSYGNSESRSMADMFLYQLDGIPASSIGAPDGNIYQAFYKHSPILWAPIMAYQAALVDPTPINGYYTLDGILNAGNRVLPSLERNTSGAINEYTFSGAYNHKDKLYLGITVGIQDLYYNQNDTYVELQDLHAPLGPGQQYGSLDNFTYRNSLRQSGVGFNVKLGAIVRPVPWFRIGLSYHTPTWFSVREEWGSDMTVYDFRYNPYNSYGFSDTPVLVSDYRMRTPSRLLAGVSFTIAQRVIISADYERTWYKSMKYSTDFNDGGYRPNMVATEVDNFTLIRDNMDKYGNIDINNLIKNGYRTTNNFRLGIEAQPINSLFLRAGYAFNESVYSAESMRENLKYHQLSAGVGYRNRMFSIDAAYVYGVQDLAPYKYYYYQPTGANETAITPSGWVNSKQQSHNILLSLGFRF